MIVSGEQRRDSAIHTHGSVLPQRAFPGKDGKESPAMQETCVRSLGQEDPLEKRMATHSSILAWRIPWTAEPVRLQSMESQRVRHNGATYTFTFQKQKSVKSMATGYSTENLLKKLAGDSRILLSVSLL